MVASAGRYSLSCCGCWALELTSAPAPRLAATAATIDKRTTPFMRLPLLSAKAPLGFAIVLVCGAEFTASPAYALRLSKRCARHRYPREAESGCGDRRRCRRGRGRRRQRSGERTPQVRRQSAEGRGSPE